MNSDILEDTVLTLVCYNMLPVCNKSLCNLEILNMKKHYISNDLAWAICGFKKEVSKISIAGIDVKNLRKLYSF